MSCGGQGLCLLQDALDRVRLEVRRVAMPAQDLLDLKPHPRPHVVPPPPVCARRALYGCHKFAGNYAQFVVAHHLDGALVFSKRIVKGPFGVIQAVFGFGAKVFRDLDQFLDDLNRVHTAVMISSD